MSTNHPHPAACPHCGGTVVSQAQPDYIVRPAQLNDDGSVIVGDPIDGADFPGPSLLYCYGCDSLYVQSAGIPERHHSALKITYPEAPAPGHPDHKGWRVAWTPVPTGGDGLTIAVAGGESGEQIVAAT